MIRSRRALGIAAGVLVLLLAAAAGIYARIHAKDGEAGDGTTAGPGGSGREAPASAQGSFSTDVAIPVKGESAVRDTLIVSVGAAGQAEAWQKTVVSAQVAGRVVALPVRESDAVRAGQLLVAVDPAEYDLAVQEAEAGVRDARAKFDETTLFDDRIPDAATRADRQRIARAKSGLDAAEVRLRRARMELARTRLGAPFASRVATLRAVPGQWVRAGDEIMTLVDLDPIKVEVQVLESEVGFLVPGRPARVSFAAYPQEAFGGRVVSINPVVEAGTRTARVTVLVDNPGGRILPGMYARVSLEARRFPDRVLVPRAAILERDRRSMLFVFDPESGSRGAAKWRYVTTGLQNDTQVEIVQSADTDSVRPGEVVLTDGHYTLIHDARVRLVQDVKASGGRPQ